MHDLVIRNGTIVDGSGNPPFTGDLAVDGQQISEIGRETGRGRREINADGHFVTPGFVDLHTHLDAQIGWDPQLRPVCWHGVTTVLMGNCGVTFAPCKPKDRDLLAGMMETVEDIPKDAILSGLPWDWESYGEYLNSIATLGPGLNVAGMVGHCAVRFYVMGERAVEEQATDDEKQEIANIVGQSIADGAVGFSTNRFPSHTLPDGRSIPGTFAHHDELIRIAEKVRPHDALMQNVLDFDRLELENDELLKKLANTSKVRILFSYGVGSENTSGAEGCAFVDELNGVDADVSALTIPRGTGFLFGLQASVPALDIWGQRRHLGTHWAKLAENDFEGRWRRIQDTENRQKLIAEAKQQDHRLLRHWLNHSYWLGAEDTPNYLAKPSDSLFALSENAGEHWSETFIRLTLESQGKGLFTWRMYNRNLVAVSDFLPHPNVYPGLTDAGAHVSQVMDSGAPTFILSHWVRDRGIYSIEQGIQKLSSGPARVIGLKNRGSLKVGYAADVNVFDLNSLNEGYPYLVHDFPGGAPRFLQKSTGYKATIVNGVINVEDGELTEDRTGKVLLHGK